MWSSTKRAPRATLRMDLSLCNKEQISACQKEESWDLCDLPGSGHISAFSEQMGERKKKRLFFYLKKVKGRTREILPLELEESQGFPAGSACPPSQDKGNRTEER